MTGTVALLRKSARFPDMGLYADYFEVVALIEC